MELAALQIKVARDGIDQAQKALDTLARSADNAEKSVNNLGSKSESSNKNVKTFGRIS